MTFIAKTPPTKPIDDSSNTCSTRDKIRKRKRVGDDSESEAETAEVQRNESKHSESDLSSETSQSEGESKEAEGPPTKRRRDKFLKKRKKPVRQETRER